MADQAESNVWYSMARLRAKLLGSKPLSSRAARRSLRGDLDRVHQHVSAQEAAIWESRAQIERLTDIINDQERRRKADREFTVQQARTIADQNGVIRAIIDQYGRDLLRSRINPAHLPVVERAFANITHMPPNGAERGGLQAGAQKPPVNAERQWRVFSGPDAPVVNWDPGREKR